MRYPSRFSLLFLAATVFSAGRMTTHAAAISWVMSEIVNTTSPTGTTADTTGTGFLATSGMLLHAENFGGPAASLDGIDFIAGVFSFGGVSETAFHVSALSPITASATFGGNSSATRTVTLGTTGGMNIYTNPLEIGKSYRIQLIVMDGRNNQAGRSYIVDGIATDHALGSPGNWGNALLATGTFVADAATQSFETQLGTRGDTQLNALVLQQIPEPAATGLLGLTGLALATRRRKA